jgi:hypothetical protein
VPKAEAVRPPGTPFGDTDQEYFADGTTDELMTDPGQKCMPEIFLERVRIRTPQSNKPTSRGEKAGVAHSVSPVFCTFQKS